MGNREKFEKIERVKDILSEYDWFFDFHSNQYVLESHSGDIGCLQASSYLDGLWYMWQARVPEGYVVVPKEPTQDQLEYGYRCGSTDAARIYRVMVTAELEK